MLNILRQERKDYGGYSIHVEGESSPVYISPGRVAANITDGELNNAGITLIEEVVAAQVLGRSKEAVLEQMQIAEQKIQSKIAGFFDDAREYVDANYPDVTQAQVKTAFVNQLKTWVADWTGE